MHRDAARTCPGPRSSAGATGKRPKAVPLLRSAFTDEKAACMVINQDAYVMLLSEPFFKTFTKREVCDTTKQTEGIFALSCTGRAEVDEMVKKALAAGGKRAMDTQDQGFMYGSSFYDLDGHHWEVFWMDPKTAE
jgi:predicted lactoylglutathione lyase